MTKSEIETMTVVQLRQTAKGVVPGFGRMSKVDLTAALIEALKLNEKPAAKKAPKASKRCEICNTRPVDKVAMRENGTPDFDYCGPCIEEANWENEHSDNGHEGMAELTLDQTNLKTEKALNEFKTETLGRMVDCWVCNPELNKASESYVNRAGTSRQGMVMNTKRSQTGKDKAEFITNALGNGYAASISTRKGLTTCKAASEFGHGCVLVWDDNGRYVYAASSVTVNGKTRKARNVSEVLRLLAV